MSLRYFIISCFSFFVLGCNNTAQNKDETQDEKKPTSDVLSETEISKLNYIEFTLDRRVEQIVEPWEPYQKLKSTIASIKTADFSFFSEEEKAIFELVKALKKDLPDTLNTLPITSRIKVLETMLYKMEDVAKLSNISKSETSAAVKDLLESFSNLNFQFNKKIEKDSRKIERPK